ncbi:winged helix-turn-helix transcriptional regulator [Sulfolobus sp. S-194]|uniref:winged helix-turn-helix transcriptional regulator n=1 Tax=Sulfolobus sp. S-194 TaxID=2512240 RepID=UPI001436E97B|nr:winged helix-turn-helix transcriptional regulator [Sulfolobus sp. S-194]QIW22959.1 winged helix-turn-helix transcriptional regulator [Sulfolobus sp. S-194]
MDALDKLIFYNIFVNPRVSKRELAKKLNLSLSSLKYRLNKLQKFIDGYYTYIDPAILGYKKAIVLHNRENISEESVRFKCIEGYTISEIFGEDINREIEKINPIFYQIIPNRKYSISKLDYKIIDLLVKNPLISEKEIAIKVGKSSKTINRHLRFLVSNNFVKIVPRIDIAKLDFLLYSLISQTINKQIKHIFKYPPIYIGFAENLEEIVKLNKFGKISIKYEYRINNWIFNDQKFRT